MDIGKEVILVTSKAIEQPNGLAPEGDLARQLASGAVENLHLFAESGAEGWSVVLGSEASLPEGEWNPLSCDESENYLFEYVPGICNCPPPSPWK